ncbi:hypothetical protein L2719_03745 [Shewanella schlegeliana]|uniref:Uncharacterized protein n=1 Tax=Shewanella schlegeliana TaxID=190308 RepID=A0ABS1SZI4_9GAMM|nr:hypothetical protein [Shewanella schlegeliana]MBL4913950.1 hypothetical protein [Shewanella schlegeliana]MCL1108666.1 hypothetical protein [Shewanella schlegeliana]GIU38345.1 hypothetical protein TUM4433_39870 [Shewanella schlegeliana]
MQYTLQQQRQYCGLAAQSIVDEKICILNHSVQTSLEITLRTLLRRYNNEDQISALTLLTLKSESLELHRAILIADMGSTEKNILLGYIDQNLENIDEAIGAPRVRTLTG